MYPLGMTHAKILYCKWLDSDVVWARYQRTYDSVASGGVGVAPSSDGTTTRTNWPRCGSSRPRPPREVTSYFAVLIVCCAPRLVSTVSRSRSPDDATKPSSRSAPSASFLSL